MTCCSCSFTRSVLVIAVLLGTVSVGEAAVVSYSESVSGDLPRIGSPLSIFAFDVGTNVIAGNTTQGTGSADTFDFDSFAFTIAPGTALVAGRVQLTDAALGNLGLATWNLGSGSLDSFGGTLIELIEALSPGTYSLTTTPLGPGDYNITSTGFGSSAGFFQNSGDYTFTFTVRSLRDIPEPGSLALVGLGVAGLWFARRA